MVCLPADCLPGCESLNYEPYSTVYFKVHDCTIYVERNDRSFSDRILATHINIIANTVNPDRI